MQLLSKSGNTGIPLTIQIGLTLKKWAHFVMAHIQLASFFASRIQAICSPTLCFRLHRGRKVSGHQNKLPANCSSQSSRRKA